MKKQMSLKDRAREHQAMGELLTKYMDGELEPVKHYEHTDACSRFPNFCGLMVELTDRLPKLNEKHRSLKA